MSAVRAISRSPPVCSSPPAPLRQTGAERVLRGAGALHDAFTVEQRDAFTQSWRGEMTFRQDGERMYECVRHEANHALPGILAGARREATRRARTAAGDSEKMTADCPEPRRSALGRDGGGECNARGAGANRRPGEGVAKLTLPFCSQSLQTGRGMRPR